MNTYNVRVRRLYREERSKNLPASMALIHARYEAKFGEKSVKRHILPDQHEASDGEEIHLLTNGWKIRVRFQRDEDHNAPWSDCDGMGVVCDGHGHPGEHNEYEEWVLNSEHGWYRWYDWKATLPEAIRDDWDAPPYRTGTKREQAMRAMKSNYELLRRWCNDDWWYIGLIVTLLDEDDTELAEDSCWGFESDAMNYITEQVRSWAAHMIVEERTSRRKAAHAARVARRFSDAMAGGI